MTPNESSLSHLGKLTDQIRLLQEDALALEHSRASDLEQIDPACRASASNLIHYLAVRQHDLRDLQRELAHLGLSSLGRMEAHVLPTLNAVMVALYRLSELRPPQNLNLDMDAGGELLRAHALRILGASPQHRNVRIMVTMPSEAATDPEIIKRALERGMDLMRVNCAHDDANAWTKMVAHLRAASSSLKRECRIEFDLAGPKLRTGAITPGPEVMKIKPQRDTLGRITVPAQIFLSASALTAPAGSVLVPLETAISPDAQVGDKLHLTDARGRKRRLELVKHSAEGDQIGWLCNSERTVYLTSGAILKLQHGKTASKVRVSRLPATPQAIILRVGDKLILTREATPGELAGASQPAHIACTLPQVFDAAKIGHRVLLDDGKIAAVIRRASPDELELEITQAPSGIAKLRAEKGINLPDTNLELPVMNATDLENLAFAAQHGDIVSLSFVRRREDIQMLVTELHRLYNLTRSDLQAGTKRLDIVLKIENRQAFENLPELLLAAMEHAPVAVMVARGDLGVEIGFERLAEVQEEMLWLCEAAHAPVIWATQVLESLAQSGLPTRAEVTDAAMAGRAECVMLNKGTYIDSAIKFLDDVLGRMQNHQEKKMAMLRKLHVSGSPDFERSAVTPTV